MDDFERAQEIRTKREQIDEVVAQHLVWFPCLILRRHSVNCLPHPFHALPYHMHDTAYPHRDVCVLVKFTEGYNAGVASHAQHQQCNLCMRKRSVHWTVC